MTHFGRIEIQGFRRLVDACVEMRPLTVLIGGNGVGKSSVLDAVGILSASADRRLANSVGVAGGVSALLNQTATDTIKIGLTSTGPGRTALEYSVAITFSGIEHAVTEEVLRKHEVGRHGAAVDTVPIEIIRAVTKRLDVYNPQGGKKIPVKLDRRDPRETSLSQLPTLPPQAAKFRDRLKSCVHYRHLNIGPKSPIRLPQAIRPTMLPGEDGEDLVSCLFNIRETMRDSYEAIEDTLRAAFPRFERLEFPPVAAGTMALLWKEGAFARPLYINELSSGTLRFLRLVALLLSPGLPAITLIDEPEASLHPEMLSLLVGILREASTSSQLIVATQSDSLVRFLRPEEVVVMDLEDDGSSKLTRADTMDLEKWLADYTLDEVWRMGRMGGRS